MTTATHRPPTGVRWAMGVLTGLLLAPWVGAALAFAATFFVVALPLVLPVVLLGGGQPHGPRATGHAREQERTAPVVHGHGYAHAH